MTLPKPNKPQSKEQQSQNHKKHQKIVSESKPKKEFIVKDRVEDKIKENVIPKEKHAPQKFNAIPKVKRINKNENNGKQEKNKSNKIHKDAGNKKPKDGANQVIQTGVKKIQKVEQVKEIIKDESEESSDIELEDIEDVDMDNQNDMLGELTKMKRANNKKDRKEKERRVTEFKFRVLDMLEIFIKKTKNPHIFILSLSQIFSCIKENSSDKEKTSFIDKICTIIKKFFERNFKMLPEYRDNVDECIVEVMKILAKESKKSLNHCLTFSALILIKIRTQMNLGDNSIIIQTLEKALEKSALKKEICYSEDMYKDVIRSSPDIAFKLIKSMLTLSLLNKDGGAKDKNRSLILNLLSYAARNTAVQKLIKENPKDSVEGLTKLMSVFTQQEDIKKKKIGVLNKYSEIFGIFASIFKEANIPEKVELKETLKDSLANWPEKDHNLKAIQKKLTEKFEF